MPFFYTIRIRYSLIWSRQTPTLANATFTSDDSLQAIRPWPQIQVLRQDGQDVQYAVAVSVSFSPAVPATVPPASGTQVLSDATGLAVFDTLVFWGVRGQLYTMHFTVDGALADLQAPINVTLCEPDEFVYNYTQCGACPSGASCNGTAVLSAQVNFWRTGWYDANGAFRANEAEQRFLRCGTSACEGGPASACRTGLGPVCGTCTGDHVFSLIHQRCVICDHSTFVYVAVYLAYAIVQVAILQFLIWRSLKSLGRSPGLGTVALRIVVAWLQTLSSVYSATQEPELNDTSFLTELVSLFDIPGRMELALGCLFGWSAYGRTVYYMFLPLITDGLVLLSSAGIALAKALVAWQGHFRFSRCGRGRARAESAADHPGLPDPIPEGGPLDSTGHRPCDHCQRTFAKWYDVDEGAYLCARCDGHLHPAGNQALRQHTRVPLQAKISEWAVVPRSTVFAVHLWEAYRLVGPAAVVGISQIFLCTDTFCDGRTPEACARYLTTDSSVACRGGGYTVMFICGILAMVVWAAGVPLCATLPILRNCKALHQERTLLRWGFLYTMYNWYAAYWELIVNLRKYIFVMLITIGYDLSLRALFGAVIVVCLLFINLELEVCSYAEPAAGRFDEVTLAAVAMTCAILIVQGDTDSSEYLLTIILVNSAAVLLLLLTWGVRDLHARLKARVPWPHRVMLYVDEESEKADTGQPLYPTPEDLDGSVLRLSFSESSDSGVVSPKKHPVFTDLASSSGTGRRAPLKSSSRQATTSEPTGSSKWGAGKWSEPSVSSTSYGLLTSFQSHSARGAWQSGSSSSSR